MMSINTVTNKIKSKEAQTFLEQKIKVWKISNYIQPSHSRGRHVH